MPTSLRPASRRPPRPKKKVKALGRRFIAIEANLISIEPVQRITDETIAGLGGLDILVNNAGLIRRTDAVDFSEQDWDDVLNVNLKSAFFMAQAAGRHFIAQGRCKIINIASMLSFQGGIRVPSYTASKSGIAGITRLLANEWASKGVTTNVIAPGYMATDNTAQLRADEDRNKAILDRIPAARWGVPADLGGTAVFLASSASDYVNGAIIPVDGGWLARWSRSHGDGAHRPARAAAGLGVAAMWCPSPAGGRRCPKGG